MSTELDSRTLEALIDELARVLNDADEARELARRAGFPAGDLPAFDTASVFWGRVVRAADVGKTLGGVGAIVEQAKVRFPGNRFFGAYGSVTVTASTPTEPRLGAAIDNPSANIGQQIVVHGNATSGAMTVSLPASAGPSQGTKNPVARRAAESLAPPRPVAELGERSRVLEDSIDVVIITAAEGEDTALLEVSEGALSPWTKIPSPDGYASEVYQAAFESLAAPGTSIHVVTTRPPRMGGDHAGVAAGQLLGAFKPRCIAICGVCAGRPDWTALGDVIIADRVWRYDTGERHNATTGGRATFKKDAELFALPPAWLRAAENAKRWTTWPGDGKEWLAARPRSLELQGLWLMKQLAEGLDPADHPDVATMCSHWTDVTAQLENDGLVVAGTLTDKGGEHLAGVLFKHQKRLPEPRPWALHVAPMGTGNHLVRDVDIWASLEDEQRLVCGFDMEASTIGLAAWTAQIHFLAVKGVMDFGLPDRHRGFRPFAARASAEVLVRLLRTLVAPPSRSIVKGKDDERLDNRCGHPRVVEGRDEFEQTTTVPAASIGLALVATNNERGDAVSAIATRDLDVYRAQQNEWYRNESARQKAFRCYIDNHIVSVCYGDVVRLSVKEISDSRNRNIETWLQARSLKRIPPPPWALGGIITYRNWLSQFPRLVVWLANTPVPCALRCDETIDLSAEDFLLPENEIPRRLCSEGLLWPAVEGPRCAPEFLPPVYLGQVGTIPVAASTFAPLDLRSYRRTLIVDGKRAEDVRQDGAIISEFLDVLGANVDPSAWAVATYAEMEGNLSGKVSPSEARELVEFLDQRGEFRDRRFFDASFAVRVAEKYLDRRMREEIEIFRMAPLAQAGSLWELLFPELKNQGSPTPA